MLRGLKPIALGTDAIDVISLKGHALVHALTSGRTAPTPPVQPPVTVKPATATAEIKYSVKSVSVTDGGDGYTDPPTVKLTGDGEGAVATAVVKNGKISEIKVTNPGTGYSKPPKIELSGSDAATPAKCEAVLGDGVVSAVKVTDGGESYKGSPTVKFSGGGGTGAEATAEVKDGKVTSVKVTAGGKGYTTAPKVEFIAASDPSKEDTDSGEGSGGGVIKLVIEHCDEEGGQWSEGATVALFPPEGTNEAFAEIDFDGLKRFIRKGAASPDGSYVIVGQLDGY